MTVRCALAADVRPRRVAAELEIGLRTVFWLAAREVPEESVRAVERQVALRCAVLDAPPVAPTDSELRSIERARVLAGARSPR